MSVRNLSLALTLCLAVGCSSDNGGDGAQGASLPPPPPLPTAAPSVPSAPVGVSPPAPGAPGLPQNPFAALQAIGQAAQQLNSQTPGGPVVNWRDLVPFLPDQLAGFQAKGDVDGSTTTMQGMQITRVARKYEAGDDRLDLKIVDTSLAPFLRAPFALVGMVQEDSSDGYKKGTSIKGQPGIAEWRKSGRSELHMLAGQRFVIDIEIKTPNAGTAERVAEALDIHGIIAAAAKAQAAAPAPVPAPVPAPPAQK
jgi:hypothetical protein